APRDEDQLVGRQVAVLLDLLFDPRPAGGASSPEDLDADEHVLAGGPVLDRDVDLGLVAGRGEPEHLRLVDGRGRRGVVLSDESDDRLLAVRSSWHGSVGCLVGLAWGCARWGPARRPI